MAAVFQLDVVSPEANLWSGEATFLVARTPEGEIGIQAGHEATMAVLSRGAVTADDADGERTTIAVQGGFLQVFKNEVTLITDRAEIVEGDADSAREAASAMEGTE